LDLSPFQFSDGFSDQFGGGSNKKMKRGPFLQKLNEIKDFPVEKQKEKIIDFFNDWKGNLEQTDDVMLVGIRL